jgi:hypothetical protein
VHKTLSALLEQSDGPESEVSDIHLRRATLEDVFLKLTGRSMRD